jgi:hypothetical protein
MSEFFSRLALPICLTAAAFMAWGAEASSPTWYLRLHGGLIGTTETAASAADSSTTTFTLVGGGPGAGIAVECLPTSRLGLELSLLFGEIETEVARVGTSAVAWQRDTLRVVPAALSLNLHLVTRPRVDLYLAPTLARVAYRGSAYSGLDATDTAVGLTVGLDLPSADGRWAFNTTLQILRSEVEGVAIDPKIFKIGARRVF